MNEFQQNKLVRFINDSVMSDAVREVIENAILERKGVKDVYILAAERISINILKEAWKEFDKYRVPQEMEEKLNVTPHV